MIGRPLDRQAIAVERARRTAHELVNATDGHETVERQALAAAAAERGQRFVGLVLR